MTTVSNPSRHSYSFTRTLWNRLKKNGGALFGLFIISLAILVAVFGYFIATDPTPNSDRQIVEVQAKKPGFRQLFLMVKKEKTVERPGFFHRLLFGVEDAYRFIPISTYIQKNDSVIVQKYIDEGVEERISIPLSGVARPHYVASQTFWLGTDRFGRDILSRLIIGTRVSLAVGFITVLISLTIGVLLGSLAGYFRGRTDNLIMWFINVIWSIPTL
ncbi:MAG: ABC transporter permease, partial [Ginsengibacter sp.]